ncbi:MAG: DUF2007 domain-containing protein [Micavibrio sp.]|nr:DUF2007 domain-containing protein [Micavibrio sp.]
MQEVFRTQDIAEIALVKSLFQSANITFFVFGEELNAMIGGFVGDNMSACRFMVLEDAADDALAVLVDAGFIEGDDE